MPNGPAGSKRRPDADRAREPAVVVLYGRPGCHLCDEARAVILALAARRGGIELREINIETDEALFAAYLERIPVVEVGGEVVGELELDPHELARRLHTVHQ